MNKKLNIKFIQSFLKTIKNKPLWLIDKLLLELEISEKELFYVLTIISDIYTTSGETFIDYEINEDRKEIKFNLSENKSFSFSELGQRKGEILFSTQEFSKTVGDVVLWRRGYPAYHLACVIDDSEQKITHVVRGLDLFDATKIIFFLLVCCIDFLIFSA